MKLKKKGMKIEIKGLMSIPDKSPKKTERKSLLKLIFIIMREMKWLKSR